MYSFRLEDGCILEDNLEKISDTLFRKKHEKRDGTYWHPIDCCPNNHTGPNGQIYGDIHLYENNDMISDMKLSCMYLDGDTIDYWYYETER